MKNKKKSNNKSIKSMKRGYYENETEFINYSIYFSCRGI